MRISVTIFVILISTCIVNASVLDPVIENIVHLKATKPPGEVSGIWKKKTIWKPRWVKEWKSAKVMKPVWRKVWSPIQIREWLPIPKPPPGWDGNSTPLVHPVHSKPHKTPPKDSLGHDSFQVHSATKVPLWDPVPYPESQQPPPAPFHQPLQNPEGSCGKDGCDNTPSQSFNEQQIMEILGQRYQQPFEYYQNSEYSETVNHLTRLPPGENNWRSPQPQQPPQPPQPPQPLPDVQFDNRFNNFQGLPEYLIPPNNDFHQQLSNNKPIPNTPPGLDVRNIPRWTPLPPENKVKGHFITKTPDQPYKFEFPESRNQNITSQAHREPLKNSNNDLKEKPNSQTQNASNGGRLHVDGDFIQEAQLVGEYHYSEFDLPSVKLEPNKPQPALQEQVKTKPVQKVIEQQRQPLNQHPVVETKPRPIHKETKQELQRPAINPQPIVETKSKPLQKDVKQPEIRNPTGSSNIQKKHIPTPPSKSSFQQQEALIREIFPVFKPLPNYHKDVNQSHALNHRYELPANNKTHQNHSSTKLLPIRPNPKSNSTTFQKQEQEYPVYERPQSYFFPPNHRFSLNSELKQQEKPILSYENSTKLVPVPPSEPENPIFDKANTVQLVFATAADDQTLSTKDYQKTTTTEPYEIIFSSSLLSTTEAVTKSPVIIVTPANSNS